jgi:hypothetical protein
MAYPENLLVPPFFLWTFRATTYSGYPAQPILVRRRPYSNILNAWQTDAPHQPLAAKITSAFYNDAGHFQADVTISEAGTIVSCEPGARSICYAGTPASTVGLTPWPVPTVDEQTFVIVDWTPPGTAGVIEYGRTRLWLPGGTVTNALHVNSATGAIGT